MSIINFLLIFILILFFLSTFLIKKVNEFKKIIKILELKLQREFFLNALLEEKNKNLKILEDKINIKSEKIKSLHSLNDDLRFKLIKNIEFIKQDKLNNDEKLMELKKYNEKTIEFFNSLSDKALIKNNEIFLNSVKSTFEKWQSTANFDLEKKETSISNSILPLRSSLEKMEKKILEIEISREGFDKSMHQQIISLIDSQNFLRKETGSLNKALNYPILRGKWGEMQLKRVVELAGMLDYCDFEEQPTVFIDKKEYRPDLLVKLPGKRNLLIDAKAPLSNYLKAIESKDESITKKLIIAHVDQIKKHINALSKKSYWEKFNFTPEFVILFLPGESFFSSALKEDPGIIEAAINNGVVIATPTTLIALLKTIAYCWKQEHLNENASNIIDISKVLLNRVKVMIQHFNNLGKNITNSVNSYNQTLASLESRVLSTVVKLENLGKKNDIIKPSGLKNIDNVIRISR